MNILLAAATIKEIDPFVEHYRSSPQAFPHSIDILITGIGLTATTFSLTKQLSIKRPDLVIQAGIGGCFDKKLPLATVVAVKQDVLADEGVIEAGQLKSVFDLGLAKPNQFPYSGGTLTNKSEVLGQVKLKKVKAVSINRVTTSKKEIDIYKEKFSPAVESMEGAALHYVCLAEKIPFIQLRSISNYIGVRDKKKWKLKESVTSLNNELINLFHQLK